MQLLRFLSKYVFLLAISDAMMSCTAQFFSVGNYNSTLNNIACNVGPDALSASLSRSLKKTIKAPQYCIPNPVDGGRDRCYYLFVPECASGLVPLVMDMHGTDSCPMFSTFYDRWAETALKYCFAVFWPIGVTDPNVTQTSCFHFPGGHVVSTGLLPSQPRLTSQGCCCYQDEAVLADFATKDLLVVKSMVQDIFAENRVDQQSGGNATMDGTRVYMAGHSNGCIGALSMSATYSDMVAAVCCHAGSLRTPPSQTYNPIPTWIVSGKLDDAVWHPLVEETWNYFGRTLHNCTDTHAATLLDGNGVVYSHENCRNNATVVMVSLNSSGHIPFYQSFELSPGANRTEIDTTEMAWEFCSSYAKDEIPQVFKPGRE
jgi:poly(3-hydroxybutyrate) depolymerase